MIYTCFRPGYLDDYKPKLSEIECSSLKSNYEMEVDKNSMWKSKKTILVWIFLFLNSTCSLSIAPKRNSVWTELCLSQASLQVKMTVIIVCTSCSSSAFFTGLQYVPQIQISLMNFPLDLNLRQSQWCLSHVILEAALTLGWDSFKV